MANEFVARNGIIALNNSQVTGSLNVSSGITGSLHGTASWAQNAISASYFSGSISSAINALTASYLNPLNQTVVLTGSFLVSGSTTQIGNNNLLGNTNLSGSINISGSITGSYNLSVGGFLRLDPSQDPGSNNLTASYLFTSASNTETGYDLYYRQDGNLVKFKWLEGGLSTGILYGGIISASGATIYVTPGAGIINNMNAKTGSEINPIITYVKWNAYTASATFLTSSQNTYLYVDSAGTVHQQTSYFDQTQYEQAIPLGRVIHANYTAITSYGSNVQTTYDSDSQQNDFIRAFGPIKVSGFTPTGQSGSLRINIGSGTAYNLGGYYPQDPNSPSHYTATQQLTSSMVRAWRTGSGIYQDNNGGSFYTVIDPTKYDDGTGTLASAPAGQYTIQRLYYNPVTKRTIVYYGQAYYNSLSTALTNLSTDPTTEGEFSAKSLIFAAYLIVKSNATDLTNTADAQFIQAGLFRNTAGGSSGGGAVAQTLDDLSDVTITTPTNGQALIYNGGTWINGNPTSASYAASSSLSQTSSYALSSSFAQTASYALNASSGITGGQNGYLAAYSGSNALTSSYILQNDSGLIQTTYQGSSSGMELNLSLLNYKVGDYNVVGNGNNLAIDDANNSIILDSGGTIQFIARGLDPTGGDYIRLETDIIGNDISFVGYKNDLPTPRQLIGVEGSTDKVLIADGWITVNNSGIVEIQFLSATGSLQGTSSWAQNVVSASYALTASYWEGTVISSSYASTASYAPLYLLTSATASMLSSYVLNSQTSSFVINSQTSSFVKNSQTASMTVATASFATSSLSASYSLTSSYALTAQTLLGSVVSASYATTASFSSDIPVNYKTVRFEMGVSSTTTITTGEKGRKTVPYTGNIVGWKLIADQSTTTVVDIWKTNNNIPTVSNTITAAAKPSLTAAQLNSSTTLTGWTTSVVAGDVFILNVDSNNNANYISLELDILLTN